MCFLATLELFPMQLLKQLLKNPLKQLNTLICPRLLETAPWIDLKKINIRNDPIVHNEHRPVEFVFST